MMDALCLHDLVGRDRYGRERERIRRRVIEHKRRRRVRLGDSMSLVFEDPATLWFQVQEMLWVEGIIDLDAVREELRVYGELVPRAGELSATLLIEIAEPAQVREALGRLRGLHRHVWLRAGAQRIAGRFEAGREAGERVSAVQYVRFPLGPHRDAVAGGAPLGIEVDHPAYRVLVAIEEATRESLAGDLRDAERPRDALRWVRDG